MKSFILFLIIFTITIKVVVNSIETKEKELFRIITPNRRTYYQYDLAENINQYNYLFVKIILCHAFSSGSHISIENEIGENIYGADIITSRNFVLNITDYANNSLIFNATSNDMYVQYQYLKEDSNTIYASGFIDNYEFGSNYISFNISPVVNDTETTYDLYYLGKINIHNDICQKVAFIRK